ncbi:MAG: exodeoxyribonuclease VII small subunit [Deltaproteobacteria bacterium]|nr:exodeoxyribonuclease VII small subunit [Deltaproteobacteria bacterium]MCD6138384.1 exodeoxyribonuclease VII small subunit [Deltaproteobacteria bacterium]RLB91328.1 MAG: exodeoxyribonuclease VII small subunit [Deltaproteobacteria bacterium]RLB93304.1 MAG: exodeoxyribonuclease VII small subunit [Deltaproteobacteria bacterium]
MAKQTFESAMKRLEEIVNELEGGDLTLDQALKKFEEGVKLSKFCMNKLDETEKKVSILLKNEEGNIREEPFSIKRNELE